MEWSWTDIGRGALRKLVRRADGLGYRVAVWGDPETWRPDDDVIWSSRTRDDGRALEAFCCHTFSLVMVGEPAVVHGPGHVLCTLAHEIGHVVSDVSFFWEGPSLWAEATADLVGATIAHETGSLSERDRFRERRMGSLLCYHEHIFGYRVGRLSTLTGPSL